MSEIIMEGWAHRRSDVYVNATGASKPVKSLSRGMADPNGIGALLHYFRVERLGGPTWSLCDQWRLPAYPTWVAPPADGSEQCSICRDKLDAFHRAISTTTSEGSRSVAEVNIPEPEASEEDAEEWRVDPTRQLVAFLFMLTAESPFSPTRLDVMLDAADKPATQASHKDSPRWGYARAIADRLLSASPTSAPAVVGHADREVAPTVADHDEAVRVLRDIMLSPFRLHGRHARRAYRAIAALGTLDDLLAVRRLS